jgi:hypothetical protein
MKFIGIKLLCPKVFLLQMDEKTYELDRELLVMQVCFPPATPADWVWIPLKESQDAASATIPRA